MQDKSVALSCFSFESSGYDDCKSIIKVLMNVGEGKSMSMSRQELSKDSYVC